MPKARSQHSWLYKQAWREGSSHGPWLYYYRNSIANWIRVHPDIFLFGEDCARPLRFHTPEWRHHVTSAHPESRSIGLRGNHWFFLEHPTEFQRQLDRFLP